MNNNCSNLPWELGISVAADVVFVDAFAVDVVAVDVVAVDVVAVDVDDDVVFVEFVLMMINSLSLLSPQSFQ